MMIDPGFLEKIKENKDPVVICGAGIVGQILLSLCEKAGIKVACFCDNSEKVSQSDFCDRKVVFTPDLKKIYKDAVFLISVVAIKDVVDLLREMGFTNWYAGGLLLKNIDFAQSRLEALIDYNKFAIENCILCHDGYLNPNKLFMRSIDLIITERCSLKCKDCSNLMQYYKKPKNCDINMLLKSIYIFCAIVDEVMDFRIIGGDVFMNKEWPVVVERLLNEPKAKRVVLYTNGTIVPNKAYLASLQHDKVLVIITDYGVLSKKLNELKCLFAENNIAYYVLTVTEWLDCAAIMPHHRTAAQNQQIYKNCCAKNMATLSDGKIFRCPYAANAARLSAVPNFHNDYIDLFQEPLNAISLGKTKQKVKDYILRNHYLQTCEYCNGRPLSGVEVPPAVQLEQPLEYAEYVETS